MTLLRVGEESEKGDLMLVLDGLALKTSTQL
jgi:hypothetical protein